MKKVLHLLASNKYSGAENVVCTIISVFDEEFDMVYCSPDGNISSVLKNKHINFIPIEKLSLKNVRDVVNKYKPDTIHAHDFKASIYASFFYKKCKIISHVHKNDPKLKVLSLKSIVYFIFSRCFFKIFVVSKPIIDESWVFRNIAHKCIVLNNYVSKSDIVKKSNDFKINKKYDLFFIGRLSSEKNPLEFIEIVHDLNDKNISAVVIGDGPLMTACKDMVKEYKLEKNIDFVGFQINPYPYIVASKIGIMPSLYEGFGLTAIESMLLNKPVLNSGVGGLSSIFDNYQFLICESRNQYITNIKKFLSEDISFSFNCDFQKLSDFKDKLRCVYK